jgi:hypothetical protein
VNFKIAHQFRIIVTVKLRFDRMIFTIAFKEP